MQAVRIVDHAVLDVPMERVSGPIRAPGGTVGTGALFAINNNADNQLATLRYQLKDAGHSGGRGTVRRGGAATSIAGRFSFAAVPGPTLERSRRISG